MDFLEQSVLPQSSHHMVLLKYLLMLAFILYIPYISILFGSLSYSLFFKRKADKTGLKLYKKFSKELIDMITFNKGAAFALGVVPLLSSVFAYAQLLHLSGLNVPVYLLISLLFLIAALFLIYTYKYTFHLKDIFEHSSRLYRDKYAEEEKESGSTDEELKEELAYYHLKTGSMHKRSALYGLIFLLVSVYLFIGSVQLAADTSRWSEGSNLFGVLFSWSALTYFLQFIAAAFAVTSAVILYRFFRPNAGLEGYEEDYREYIKSFALRSGLISTIALPAFVVMAIISKPVTSLSFSVFGITVVVLALLLLASSLFYVMLKESSVKFSSSVIYLFLLLFAFIVIKDQLAFYTSTKKQTALLAANYGEYEKKLKEQFGISSAPINGADIFNGRCIACHSFDKKIVGPPYNQIMPKYEGKKDQLVKYIMNPVKVDPEYPAMPNQGLKPNEAEAAAEYLLNTYKKEK